MRKTPATEVPRQDLHTSPGYRAPTQNYAESRFLEGKHRKAHECRFALSPMLTEERQRRLGRTCPGCSAHPSLPPHEPQSAALRDQQHEEDEPNSGDQNEQEASALGMRDADSEGQQAPRGDVVDRSAR